MTVNELSQKECDEMLTRAWVGRLGCALDNQPYVVPVCLAYEPGYIYVFATLGQKIEWMRANPKVCLQVDEIAGESQWVSVIAYGRYQELPEPQFEEERAHARKLLEKFRHWWLNPFAERRTRSDDMAIAPVFFRIQVDAVTGLRAVPDGGKTAAA